MMTLSSSPRLDLRCALSFGAVIAACWIGPPGLGAVAAAQSVTTVRLDPESPHRDARLELDLREELAEYRAQAIGAGFITVIGVILTLASLPGLIATGWLASDGVTDDSLKFGAATAVSLAGGLALSFGGGTWWMGSNANAAQVSARLSGAGPRSSMEARGGGMVLLRQSS